MTATFFVSCTPGLKDVLAEEVTALQLGKVRRVVGGVEVEASRTAYEPLNRWSRIGSRVLMRVATVSQPSQLAQVSLRDFRRDGGPIRVEVAGPRPWLDAAERAWGLNAPADAEALDVLVRVDGRASVSVDTTGELLHFRGYRQEIGRAPMRETLAAGVLALAKWDGAEPLWDVMCGSGTLVIEAAEKALGLAPGRNRHFAFERFAAAASPPPAEATRASAPAIIGSDLNAGALGTARRNAKRAGVFEHLTLERLDATRLQPRPELPVGLVVANLPYGRRVGDRSDLAQLYRSLGASLRKACPGWRFAFLLEEGAEHLGLELSSRAAVSNGGLRCEVVQGRV